MAFLTVDLGTSSCRACLVDHSGKVRVVARRPVVIDIGAGGEAEIDPGEAWLRVKAVLRDFRENFPRETPEALGISSFLGYVFLSKNSDYAAPAVLYQDTRARAEAEELDRAFPAGSIYGVTGRRMSPGLLAPVLLRKSREDGDFLGKTRTILGLKDELVRRLTGEIATDFAHMNYTYLFDLGTAGPHADLCEAVGVNPGVFPDPRPAQSLAGKVTGSAAAETGLPEGLPVIVGSIDGTTSMYGAGLTLEDGFPLVTGTTDVMMRLSRKAVRDGDRILNVNTGMVPGTYAVGGATGAAGGTLTYFLDLFGMSREEASSAAAGIEPKDADPLFVFPGITGERSPYWTENASGGIVGLRPSHGRAHIVRAVMEACAFRLARLRDALESNGLGADRVLLSGGASLPEWNRIRADVLGLPVDVLAEKEATTLGTALFCRAALEKDCDLRKASSEWIRTEERFEPSKERHERYGEKRKRFETLLGEIFG